MNARSALQNRTSTQVAASNQCPWSTRPKRKRSTTFESEGSINRYYDPSTDQFISVDPDVQTTDQPYVFVNGDPLNATDPLGMSGQEILNEEKPCSGNCTGLGLFSLISHHWRGLAQIATVAIGLAGCTTIIACALIGVATGGAFYAEGSVGTSHYSIVGQVVSLTAGGILGAANGEGQVLLENGTEQTNQTLDRGLLHNLTNPIESVNSIAKGSAKVVSGAIVKVSAQMGNLICDAHRRCP